MDAILVLEQRKSGTISKRVVVRREARDVPRLAVEVGADWSARIHLYECPLDPLLLDPNQIPRQSVAFTLDVLENLDSSPDRVQAPPPDKSYSLEDDTWKELNDGSNDFEAGGGCDAFVDVDEFIVRKSDGSETTARSGEVLLTPNTDVMAVLPSGNLLFISDEDDPALGSLRVACVSAPCEDVGSVHGPIEGLAVDQSGTLWMSRGGVLERRDSLVSDITHTNSSEVVGPVVENIEAIRDLATFSGVKVYGVDASSAGSSTAALQLEIREPESSAPDIAAFEDRLAASYSKGGERRYQIAVDGHLEDRREIDFVAPFTKVKPIASSAFCEDCVAWLGSDLISLGSGDRVPGGGSSAMVSGVVDVVPWRDYVVAVAPDGRNLRLVPVSQRHHSCRATLVDSCGRPRVSASRSRLFVACSTGASRILRVLAPQSASCED